MPIQALAQPDRIPLMELLVRRKVATQFDCGPRMRPGLAMDAMAVI